MKPGFGTGVVREITVTVTDDMCPASDGAVVHRCYSRWSAVHHVEPAVRKVLADFFLEDEEAIGTHVGVDHVASSPVGRTPSRDANERLIRLLRDSHDVRRNARLGSAR